MVWEHRIFVILMLTKEVENGKVFFCVTSFLLTSIKIKSARYWPEWTGAPNALAYGQFQVTIAIRTDHKDTIRRNLIIENIQVRSFEP